jgi:hypothetical protein
MKSLKVDGVEQPLTDEQKTNGGTYTFERLNKYPLPKRDIRTGQVLEAQDSGFYTIEAAYEQAPDYTVTKTSDTPYLDVYDDWAISYEIRAEEVNPGAPAGTYNIIDDMANGLLILEGEPEVTVSGGKADYDATLGRLIVTNVTGALTINTATPVNDVTATPAIAEIYDIAGNLLVSTSDANAALTTLPAGMYIIRQGSHSRKVLLP